MITMVAVACLSFAVNMVWFGNINADECTELFSFMSRMRCYVLNIVLSYPREQFSYSVVW